MEDYLNNAIDNFIGANIYNRALFFTGEWGSGKTYFLKNVLRPYLKNKGYDFFYISVNGIDSIEDLKKQIITTALTISRKNKDSAMDKLIERAKRAVRYFDKTDILFSVFELSDFINLEETVFCFDDLERIDKSLHLSSVLGFINTELIEHKSTKVILVGDETKNQLDIADNHLIKEKYIGWTVKYISNSNAVIDNIINTQKEIKPFYEYLNTHQEFIKEVVNNFEFNNFRTLQFFLETLKIVYYSIQRKYENIEKDIIYFTLVMCNEFKNGHLQRFKSIQELPSYITGNKQKSNIIYNRNTNQLESQFEEDNDEIDKEERERFSLYTGWNKFIMHSEYGVTFSFVESIYSLIVGGYLDENKLVKSVDVLSKSKPKFHKHKENTTIIKLTDLDNISQEDFNNNLVLVKGYIESKKYNIYELIQIIRYLFWLSTINVIEDSYQQIEDLANIYLESFHVNPENVTDIVDTIGIEPFLKEIKKYSPSLYESITHHLKSIYKEQSILKIRDSIAKIENILEHENFNEAVELLDSDEFAKSLIANIDNRKFVRKLTGFIKDFYKASNARDFYNSHIGFLSMLKSELESNLDRYREETISVHYISLLVKELNDSISHLQIEE